MPYFGEDIFAGTAAYYAKYRPAYPPALFKDIASFYGLNGHGFLLDLGCGTGELAIPLAGYFERVLAIDPDPGMLVTGRAKAAKLKITNIDWQKGSSRTLTGVKDQFRLITMGQAYHWTDEVKTLQQLFEMTEPGGGLVIVGSGPVAQNRLAKRKDEAVTELLAKYLGPRRRAGRYIYKPSSLSWEKQLFPYSAYGGFKKRVYVIKVVRDLGQIVGVLYSMSWARREYFGPHLDDFEAELRQKLSSILAGQKLAEQVRFEAFFLTKNG